jgi:hypothetical protein
MVMRIIRRAKEFWSWYSFITGVSALALAGATAAIGGVVWAVNAGIALPLAFMAGFCTLVGAVYLTMAPLVFRVLVRAGNTEAIESDKRPNYQAFQHVDRFTLSDAAKLWCDRDPSAGTTYDTVAWREAFESEIRGGRMKFIPRNRANEPYEREHPAGDTLVDRKALKAFAGRHNYDPRFLRDESGSC